MKVLTSSRAALLDAAQFKGDEAMEYWETIYKPTLLIAPIDGTVIVSQTQPGQSIAAEQAIVVIADRLIVSAYVNESDIGNVAIGQKAKK